MDQLEPDITMGPRPSRGPTARRRARTEDPELQEILRIVRDPRTDPSAIRAIGENRRWQACYEVRAAIVFRPGAPIALALHLMGTLWWHDLARALDDPRLYPPLRARAEKLLAEKSAEMTPGEKISLARVASRTLIKVFRDSRDPRVVRALLGNPRLYEEDVVLISNGEKTAPAVLSTIARSSRWGSSYQVKLALAQHPRCPAVDSLRSLRGLQASDLQRIADNPAVPRLVRIGASRMLADA